MSALPLGSTKASDWVLFINNINMDSEKSIILNKIVGFVEMENSRLINAAK